MAGCAGWASGSPPWWRGWRRARYARIAPRQTRVAVAPALPRKFGWLSRLMPEGNLYADYLEQQVGSDAAMAALLATAPQAGRQLAREAWLKSLGK